MFTGIVKGLFEVTEVRTLPGMTQLSVRLSASLIKGLNCGASVAIDGVCLTVVKIEGQNVWFDIIEETLQRTTLGEIRPGQWVNVERSAKFSDEIGGHIVSGHVFGKATILKIEKWENNTKMSFRCPTEWTKYLFPKGFLAIDGASLTLVDVSSEGSFSVHLIPETLRMTTLGRKKQGDSVNIELESRTQSIVETIERIIEKNRQEKNLEKIRESTILN